MSKRSKRKNVAEVVENEGKYACNNERQVLSQLRRFDWDVEFRNESQRNFYNLIDESDITFCSGPAGTGKSFVSSYYALKNLADKTKSFEGIIITKPMVEADGERIGFLPGNVDDKCGPYMMSYYYNMERLIGKSRLKTLLQTQVIQVIPMAYMRGLTFFNKIVILDEAQNASVSQIKMLLTRIGMNSKYIIAGDLKQTDRIGENGLLDSVERLVGVDGVGICEFDESDIVRHRLIGKILERYDCNGNGNNGNGRKK